MALALVVVLLMWISSSRLVVSQSWGPYYDFTLLRSVVSDRQNGLGPVAPAVAGGILGWSANENVRSLPQ